MVRQVALLSHPDAVPPLPEPSDDQKYQPPVDAGAMCSTWRVNVPLGSYSSIERSSKAMTPAPSACPTSVGLPAAMFVAVAVAVMRVPS